MLNVITSKEALSDFVEPDQRESSLFRGAGTPKITDKTKRREFEDMLYDDTSLSDDEIESILRARTEITKNSRTAKVNSAKLISLLKAVKNPQHLEFLGNTLCNMITEAVTKASTDRSFAENTEIKKQRNRRDYFTDAESWNRVLDIAIDALDNVAEGLQEDGKNELADEIYGVIDNWETVLYMFGGKMFRDEGIEFDMDGHPSGTELPSGSSEMNESDVENSNEDSNDDDDEKPLSSFSASEQDKSVMTKIAPSIKSLLASIRLIQRNGTELTDKYGFGLPVYLKVNTAVNKLLRITRGCQKYSEMVEAMQRNANSTPWLQYLLDVMDTNESQDNTVSDMIVSNSRKEQLQSMFFSSFRKQGTVFNQAFFTYRSGGLVVGSKNTNLNNVGNTLYNKVIGLFNRMTNHGIIKNGSLNVNLKDPNSDFNKHRKFLNDIKKYLMPISVSLQNKEVKNITDIKDEYRMLADVEKKVLDALDYVGIKTSHTVLDSFLNNNHKGLYARAKNKEIKYRMMRLEELCGIINPIYDEHAARCSAIMTGKCKDSFSMSPFDRNTTYFEEHKNGTSEIPGAFKLGEAYGDCIQALTEFSDDSFEAMSHIGGKSYYSYNNPSSIGTVIETFKYKTQEQIRAYIDKKYGQDQYWFINESETRTLIGKDQYGRTTEKNRHPFYSNWLERIYSDNGDDLRKVIDYRERLIFDGKKYTEMTDLDYDLSILSDYFTQEFGYRGRECAWYRMLIASDKPRYSSVRFFKYNTIRKNSDGTYHPSDYHSRITNEAKLALKQELKRAMFVISNAQNPKSVKIDKYDVKINDGNRHVFDKIKNGEKVTCKDVIDDNGLYIFRNTGASFFFNKFIVNEIQNKTELGEYIVDKIFNQSSQSDELLLNERALELFTNGFQQYMLELRESYMQSLFNHGVMSKASGVDPTSETGEKMTYAKFLHYNLLKWNNTDAASLLNKEYDISEVVRKYGRYPEGTKVPKDEIQYWNDIACFEENVEEFIYNNWMAKVNMAQIFDIDLAFYGSTVEFQKRNAQVVSSGMVLNEEACIHGQRVFDDDAKLRAITLKTEFVKSDYKDAVINALNKRLAEITDPLKHNKLKLEIAVVSEALDNIDPTDGQAYVSLSGLRKKRAGLGEWSMSDDSATDDRDDVFTDEAIYRRAKRNALTVRDLMHVFAEPQKPFVYSQTTIQHAGDRGNMIVPVHHKNSEYMLPYLTAFIKQESPDCQLAAMARFLEESAEGKFGASGIDTINFDSATKVACGPVIDISGLDGQRTYERLKQACYLDGKTRESGYRQGVVVEYDVMDYKLQQTNDDHFKHNQQPMGSQMKVLSVNNIPGDSVIQLRHADGSYEEISGKELRDRYLAANAKKVRKTVTDFQRQSGMFSSFVQRGYSLSNMLKNAMSSDQRFDSEMRRALSIVDKEGDDSFVIPLDEPTIQGQIESMLYSKIRKVYYKEKMNGGPAIQASSYGQKEDLGIRFYDTNNHLIQTKSEFKRNYEEHHPGTKLGGGRLEKAYSEYLAKHPQGNLAYFEMEAPMPDYIKRMLIDPKTGLVAEKYYNKDKTYNMEEIKKVIPAGSLDAICYRIPSEAKYSMMPCRIVRFTPEGSGSAAFFPKEITLFTGFGFDLENCTTVVGLRPQKRSKTKTEDNELFDYQFAALVSSPATQEMFKPRDFSDLSEMSYRTTLERAGYTKEEVDKMKGLKKRCAEIEDLDLMNPSTDTILHRQNSDAGDMIAIAAVGVTSHAFIQLYNDPSDPDISHKTRIVFKAPSKTRKVNQVFSVVNDQGGTRTEMRIADEVVLDPMYDMDGGLVSTELSKYVGASADAAKDAALYRLNITTKTLPWLIFMHRIGISSKVARQFISQQSIRDVINYMQVGNNGKGMSLDYAINTVLNDIMESEGWSKEELDNNWAAVRAGEVTLVASELEEGNTLRNEVSPYKKLEQLHVLEIISQKANMVRNLDSYTRYNSTAAMKGTSYLDRYIKRRSLSKLEKNLSGENPTIKLPENIEILDGSTKEGPLKVLYSMFNYVGMTIEGEEMLTDSIMLDNMKTYGKVFFEMYESLGVNENMSASAESKLIHRFYNAWKNYLMFAGTHRIADFNDQSISRELTHNYADKFFKTIESIEKNNPDVFKEFIEDNTFIDSMYSENSPEGYEQFQLLSCNVNNMAGDDIEKFKADWSRLLDNKLTRPLAIESAVYFLSRMQGRGYNRTTPTHLIPIAVKEAIPGYTDVFQKADDIYMSEEDKENFILQFLLNNTGDETIVPKFEQNGRTIRIDKQEEGFFLVLQDGGCYKMRKYIGAVKKDAEGFLVADCSARIITVGDAVFHIKENQISVNKFEDKNGSHEGYAIYIEPVDPRGIPNQFIEYSKLDPITTDSIFHLKHMSRRSYSKNKVILVNGNRSGSYTYIAPYTSEKVSSLDELNKYLASSKKSNTGHSESKRFLMRVGKIASAFGMNITSTHKNFGGYRMNDGNMNRKPSYTMKVSTRENLSAAERHEESRRIAALASLIAGERQESVMTVTYCDKNDEKANGIEYCIPLRKDSDIHAVESLIRKTNLEYYTLDTNANELRIVSSNKKGKDIAKTATKLCADLYKKGLAASNEVEQNYVIYDTDYSQDREEILNTIKDELQNGRTETGGEGIQETFPGGEEEEMGRVREGDRKNGHKNWEKNRLLNYIDFAEKVNRKERVTGKELSDMFGDGRVTQSHASTSIVFERVMKQLENKASGEDKGFLESALLELQQEIDNETQSGSGRVSMYEAALRNTINWIVGKRPDAEISEEYELAGITGESAETIMKEIENILEENDIC